MPDGGAALAERPLAADLPAELLERVAERAKAVDRAEASPYDVLGALAADDLLGCGLPGGPGSLGRMAGIVAALSERCLATGFITWAHRMALEYLVAAGDDTTAAELRGARRTGATAMAGAFRACLGLEPLAITGRREGGELVLDGTIPWASNLVPGGVIVTAAEIAGEGPAVLVLDRDTEGLAIREHRGLLALDATASGALTLAEARVGADRVVRAEFRAFLAGVRPPFLALQTAFCLGVARAALAAGAAKLEGLGAELAEEHAELERERESVEHRLAAHVGDAPVALRDRVALRLDAAVLAREAVRVEAAVTGGRGYALRSATARRLREAAFIPVQSPTETQLRWELRRSA